MIHLTKVYVYLQAISRLSVTYHAGTEGKRGIASLIPNLSDRWGWVVNAKARPFYTRKRAQVPFAQETLFLGAGLDGHGM